MQIIPIYYKAQFRGAQIDTTNDLRVIAERIGGTVGGFNIDQPSQDGRFFLGSLKYSIFAPQNVYAGDWVTWLVGEDDYVVTTPEEFDSVFMLER